LIRELIAYSLVLIGIMFLAIALAYGAAKWLSTRSAQTAIPENATLKIRGESGMYRARFLGSSERGWRFGAPLRRDSYVPLRVGEILSVEAALPDGAALFRTRVLHRDDTNHEVVMERPKQISRIDRREMARWVPDSADHAVLDGKPARIVDLSNHGARVESQAPRHAGERICLDHSHWAKPVFGWVLETWPIKGTLQSIRIRFEEPLS
jgi:hypothetical protein